MRNKLGRQFTYRGYGTKAKLITYGNSKGLWEYEDSDPDSFTWVMWDDTRRQAMDAHGYERFAIKARYRDERGPKPLSVRYVHRKRGSR